MSQRNSRETLFSKHYLATVRKVWIIAEPGWKNFFDRNIIQDYGFLSCRNELLFLAIVLTYISTENCGIRINSTHAGEISLGFASWKFSHSTRAINPEYHSFRAIISPYYMPVPAHHTSSFLFKLHFYAFFWNDVRTQWWCSIYKKYIFTYSVIYIYIYICDSTWEKGPITLNQKCTVEPKHRQKIFCCCFLFIRPQVSPTL